MATVTFSKLWLHNSADLSDNLGILLSDISRSNTSDAITLKMANGRLVSVSRPGLMSDYSVRLKFITRADLEWIEARTGTVVLVRTPHGDKLFARIGDVRVSETKLPGTVHDTKVGDVSFSLSEVTHSEVV